MAKVRLTPAAIERYRPVRGKVREIPDLLSEGLSLSITPTGTRIWTMRFRRPSLDGKPGKAAQLTLGRYDASGHEFAGDEEFNLDRIGTPLSLSAARALASWVHIQRRRGRDVIKDYNAHKTRIKAQAQDNAANTYAAAAKEFIEKVLKVKRRRWQDMAVALGWDFSDANDPVMRPGGLSQRWADKPIGEIDDADIFEVVREAGRTGIPGTKAWALRGKSDSRERAMFAALSGLFKWLKEERRIKVNPCIGAVKLAPFKIRDRVLTDDEIRWFWAACEKEGWPFGPVLQVLLLSAQRLNEIAQMRKSELRDGVLYLSGERTKNKRPHLVPLSELSISILPKSDGDLIFSTNGRTAVSGWSTLKARLDLSMLEIARKEKGADFTIEPWVIHDLRRTAATGMGELGIAPHVVEAILNHVSGSKAGVAGTYNRSILLPERKAGLQRWADHVFGLVSGTSANVIPLRREVIT